MFKKKEDEIPEERKQAIFLKIRPILAEKLKINEDKILRISLAAGTMRFISPPVEKMP